MTDPSQTIISPAGALTLRTDLPPHAPRAVAIIVPPHPDTGVTLHAHVVYHAAQALVRVGAVAVRFDLPPGTADAQDGQAEHVKALRAVMAWAAARFPDSPVWLLGVSYGAAVAAAVTLLEPAVRLLVGISAPVDAWDLKALAAHGVPVFLIHGEADTLVPARAVRRAYGQLTEPRELVMIEDADHLFDGKASLVADAVVDLLEDWTDA